MMANFLEISIVLLWIVVIVQVIFMRSLANSVSSFLEKIRVTNSSIVAKKTLTEGSGAPFFVVKNHKNKPVNHDVSSNTKTVLIFTKSSCSVCERVIDNLDKIIQTNKDYNYIIVGDKLNNRIDEKYKNIKNINFTEDLDLIQKFEVEVVPYLVIIDKNSVIELIRKINHPEELLKYLSYDQLVSNI